MLQIIVAFFLRKKNINGIQVIRWLMIPPLYFPWQKLFLLWWGQSHSTDSWSVVIDWTLCLIYDW